MFDTNGRYISWQAFHNNNDKLTTKKKVYYSSNSDYLSFIIFIVIIKEAGKELSVTQYSKRESSE